MYQEIFKWLAAMLLLLGCGGAWAAACQPTNFDSGATRFEMAGGANAEVLAFQCSRAALLNAVPGLDGQYLAYKIRWANGLVVDEFYFGDVGKDADGVVALKAERVSPQMLAVIEESERGGRLYLWQKDVYRPFVLDFMGSEDSSLCLSAQKDGITINHCHGKRNYGPKLRVRWLKTDSMWQTPTWQEIRAFNAAGPSKP